MTRAYMWCNHLLMMWWHKFPSSPVYLSLGCTSLQVLYGKRPVFELNFLWDTCPDDWQANCAAFYIVTRTWTVLLCNASPFCLSFFIMWDLPEALSWLGRQAEWHWSWREREALDEVIACRCLRPPAALYPERRAQKILKVVPQQTLEYSTHLCLSSDRICSKRVLWHRCLQWQWI